MVKLFRCCIFKIDDTSSNVLCDYVHVIYKNMMGSTTTGDGSGNASTGLIGDSGGSGTYGTGGSGGVSTTGQTFETFGSTASYSSDYGSVEKNIAWGGEGFTVSVTLLWIGVIALIGLIIWRVKYWRGDNFPERFWSFCGFNNGEEIVEGSRLDSRRSQKVQGMRYVPLNSY